MDRTTIMQAWRESCGSDEIMCLPPTGRLLEKFAKRIEAITREACAVTCEAEEVEADLTGEPTDRAYNMALRHAAAAIRAS